MYIVNMNRLLSDCAFSHFYLLSVFHDGSHGDQICDAASKALYLL